MGVAYHTACISFWIPKRQAISTDNGFIFKKKSIKIKREKRNEKPNKIHPNKLSIEERVGSKLFKKSKKFVPFIRAAFVYVQTSNMG